MGGQRNGRAKEWQGKGMAGQRNGRAKEWEGKGMGGQRNFPCNRQVTHSFPCPLIPLPSPPPTRSPQDFSMRGNRRVGSSDSLRP